MKIDFQKIEPPPLVTSEEWNSWKWQIRKALKTKADFDSLFELKEHEKKYFQKEADGKVIYQPSTQRKFKTQTTPYYAQVALQTTRDGYSPIRSTMIPAAKELGERESSLDKSSKTGFQEMLDPLGEVNHSPTPRVVHRYTDRCLLLVTDLCSVYCRYCTRKRFTGKDQSFLKASEFEEALKYIGSTPQIREVILSGGDPLTLSDEKLERVLFELRKLENVELIRIGSRMPVVCPMRIDKDLVKMLRSYKPTVLMTHFNHPVEITTDSASAIELFVENGVPVYNQMVLLNGVNNHASIVKALSRRLLWLGAKPYYMLQCDPSEGTDHFRTSIDNSMKIQKELWGHTSGLAMPNLIVDIPGGGGKVGITPSYEVTRDGQNRSYKGWDGLEGDYVSPCESKVFIPQDSEIYKNEY